jgi:hypothetical protein
MQLLENDILDDGFRHMLHLCSITRPYTLTHF